MKIIISGGGTIGSVSPLIAIFEEIKRIKPDAEFLWLATKNGPEIELIKSYNIPIKEIYSGKLRRYFSFQNFIDPFRIFLGFIQSFFIIKKFKPQVILSAGGFVAVPVVWAGWFLRRPCLIHQQDIRPGLANKLMANFASIITVTFEKSLKDFNPKKTKLVGNPVRKDILNGSRQEATKIFNLDQNLPTVLVIGGGTGALNLNNLVINSLQGLVSFCQVIHITGGRGKTEAKHSRYHSFEFLTDKLKHAYAAADLVVSRAGLSSLTELAALGKPSIIIPIPNSHQEENVIEFFKNQAIALLKEKNLNPDNFPQAIKEVLSDKVELENLSRNIKKVMPNNAVEKIIEMIL